VKKPKKGTRSAATPEAVAPEPLPDPERDSIGPGDVVMLPDGAVAAVDRIVGQDAYVVEWQKQLGRGPWIFPVADLVLVS